MRKLFPLRLQIVTLFLLLMWFFFNHYQPWEAIDTDILVGTGEFSNVTDLSEWSREQGQIEWSDDTGYVALKPTARLRFNLPTFAGDLLLSSGRIKTQKVETGKQPWDAGRILVYFEDAQGNINWSYPHNVGFLSGTEHWTRFTTIIKVPTFAKKGWIELAHYGRSGVVSFDDITVKPAIWKPTFPRWQMFFGMFWAALMMWLVLNTHLWSLSWGKATLISATFIIIGVTLPPATMFQVANRGAELSAQVLHRAVEAFPSKNSLHVKERKDQLKSAPVVSRSDKGKMVDSMTDPVVSPKALRAKDIQKLGHAVLFALFGYFAFLTAYQKIPLGLLVYILILFAFSTEVLQLVIDGRLFVFTDLLIDLTGVSVGVFNAFWISRARSLI